MRLLFCVQLWPWLLGFAALLVLVYGGWDCVLRPFHRRRIRVYFTQTHPQRHLKENRKRQVDVRVPAAQEIVHCSFAPAATSESRVWDGVLRICTWNIELGNLGALLALSLLC